MKNLCARQLLTIIVVLCALHPAWAAWTGAVSMGTTVVLSDLSCASPSTGLAVCAARGVGQTLIVNQWTELRGLSGKPSPAPLRRIPAVPQMAQAKSSAGYGMLPAVFPQPSITVQPGARLPALAVVLPQNLAALSSRWGMCYAWAAVRPVAILRAFSTEPCGVLSRHSRVRPYLRRAAAATVLVA